MKKRPVIKLKEFAQRREQLMHMIGGNAVAIVPSSGMMIRNRDVEYPFRQNSDFLYLTGFNEPEAIAFFIPGREQGQYIIFCRKRDKKAEQWVGRREGLDGVQANWGADDAYPIDDIDDILPGLLEERSSVYYNTGSDATFDQQVMGWVNKVKAKRRNGVHAPQEFISLPLILHDMRLYKSAAELRAMKFASKVSMKAHQRAMQRCCPSMMEWELEAEYLYTFKKSGLEPAYSSIVGGGDNACILHYIDNHHELKAGDLVLIDAGAEYLGYASDITRTFPVNGKFTSEQAAIYQVVYDAQQAAIEMVKPGNTWDQPHEAALRVLVEGLVELGLLKGDVDKLIEKKKYMPFYMHKTGHWLGLDVHDVGDYKVADQWRLLEPGMVLTVEPGLYISPCDKVDKKWWNIGVRIEDDVIVTKQGYEVITSKLPRTIDEIEALMASDG
ncbi:MAG: Xaa-Pro aminopeptidase [Thiotrichaceae bacterium]|nr:Xaa-Pro aminopeptidase [Thiotrichaceae bacterium]